MNERNARWAENNLWRVLFVTAKAISLVRQCVEGNFLEAELCDRTIKKRKKVRDGRKRRVRAREEKEKKWRRDFARVKKNVHSVVRGPETDIRSIYVRSSLLHATVWQTISAELDAVCVR